MKANWPRIAVIALIVTLGVIIIAQNTDAAETQILFITVRMPRALMLASVFALGFALGFAVSWRRGRRQPGK